VDAAEDVRHGTKRGIRSWLRAWNNRFEQRRSVCWACERTTVDNLIRDRAGSRARSRCAADYTCRAADVGIHKSGKLAPQAAQVPRKNHSTPAKIMLQGQIHLVDLRILEMRVEEGNVPSSSRRQTCEDHRKRRSRHRRNRRGREEKGILAARRR